MAFAVNDGDEAPCTMLQEFLVEPRGQDQREMVRDLAAKVLRCRHVWLAAWRERLPILSSAMLEDLPPTPTRTPGSCQIKSNGAVLAKFIVQMRVGDGAVTVEAEWPQA